MTKQSKRACLIFVAAMFLAPALASAANFSSGKAGPALAGGINCSSNKVCLCKGKPACKKLAANCAGKLQGGKAPSGGVYGKCNHVLSKKPLGLAVK